MDVCALDQRHLETPYLSLTGLHFLKMAKYYLCINQLQLAFHPGFSSVHNLQSDGWSRYGICCQSLYDNPLKTLQQV